MNRGRGGLPGKPWVHPPESLLRGQVIYNVKFLGHVEVDQPKGSEMVRDAIRKMKFNRQIKKAEGQKPLKVELSLSIDAVKIQDPKMKIVQFQYPLHHVSYCADDKSDKRMFTFIAKEKDSNKHHCFVFDSDKSAEEITLTVGQAFDLAYRRFLDSSSKDIDSKKQLLILQKKIQELTDENQNLKQRINVLEKMVETKPTENVNHQATEQSKDQTAARKFENLRQNSLTASSMSNGINRPVAPSSSVQPSLPILSPPPPIPARSFSNQPIQHQQFTASQDFDLFGSQPFNATAQGSTQSSIPAYSASANSASDVFGMNAFSPSTSTTSPYDIDQQIQRMDSELLDLQANFSRGLSFGTEDFSLDDLDPLKK